MKKVFTKYASVLNADYFNFLFLAALAQMPLHAKCISFVDNNIQFLP